MDKACTLLVHYDKSDAPLPADLKNGLEKGDVEEKIRTMKKLLLLMVNGEKLPNLLMTVIRFVMPSKDHTLKKLLLLYWEVCEKHAPDGSLLQEMILVCNALRNDLTHPNEYIRGSCCRFLCKLHEPELLEPLVPSIRANLDHRHSYVRRNAVLAIYCIFNRFPDLIPDAPDLILDFLSSEGDASCKRNAFIMLLNTAQDKAIEYLGGVLDQVSGFSDILQFVVVGLIRKVCRTTPSLRSKYIRCIFMLLKAGSSSVRFEAARALLAMSAAPAAVREASRTFIALLCSESDNNVKLIILDRLLEIRKLYPKVLQGLIMDVLRALSCPDMDIRRKTIDVALGLVSPDNIDDVIAVFKKEIATTHAPEVENAEAYRRLLIKAIHSCAVRYPSVAGNVVHVLLDFVGEGTGSSVDVISFVREVMETYPELRSEVLSHLLSSLRFVTSADVFRAALWLVGEFCQSIEEVDVAFNAVKDQLGVASAKPDEGGEDETEEPSSSEGYTPTNAVGAVLPDGTYATQSAITESARAPAEEVKKVARTDPTLHVLLVGGDLFLGSAVATCLTKLVLRSWALDIDSTARNAFVAEVLRLLTFILRQGHDEHGKPTTVDLDSLHRVSLCLRLLADPSGLESAQSVFKEECRRSYKIMLDERMRVKHRREKTKEEPCVQPDDLISVRQLSGIKTYGNEGFSNLDEFDISQATGQNEMNDDVGQPLDRLTQLTGFSDPVYAEAYVNAHQFDINLDVLIINRTPDTLQNVCLELATLGDLKLVERPHDYTIGPYGVANIQANVKVSSTETGIIFGNIVYDVAGSASADSNIVMLNDIHVDIMDYINPAHCTPTQFRKMWAEFEWENKVAICTVANDVRSFLDEILACTNMACLSPPEALEGDCGFLSANLHARSVFGEDALANFSVEQIDDNIVGFVRIRSKTQGIALSLGDKITQQQRTRAQSKEA